MTVENNKELAISLINELRSGRCPDERQEEIASILYKLLPDSSYWDYLIDHVPELSAEEVVERAFDSKPIIL
ncbi:hypothetical protein SD208_16600 [Ochrobactrum sp. BD67]